MSISDVRPPLLQDQIKHGRGLRESLYAHYCDDEEDLDVDPDVMFVMKETDRKAG